MSAYSGKFDACDYISGMGGWYDREGNPVKFGAEGVSVYYSDEYQDFLAFKKKTNGTLYQHLRVEVTERNQDFIAEHCNYFKVITHTKMVPDKRTKSGEKESIYYTYLYYDKEYKSLKEINKKHVYIVKEIHFNSLLDLLPYYPYIITTAVCDGDTHKVWISARSYVDEEEDRALKHGWKRSLTDYYRQQLAKHYQEVVLRYYNPVGREVEEYASFDPETRQAVLANGIDDRFSVTWTNPERKSFWTSPEVIDYDNGIIKISEIDLKTFGETVLVSYVKKKEKEEIFLG